MSKLRDVAFELVKEARSKVKFDEKTAWEPVSEVRGLLAKYMSELEEKVTRAEMEKNGVVNDFNEQSRQLRSLQAANRESERKVREAEGARDNATRVLKEQTDNATRVLKEQTDNVRYWRELYSTRPTGTRLADASVRELFEQLAKKFNG